MDYFIDWHRWVWRMLPIVLRTARMTAWVGALLSPFRGLNDSLTGLVSETRYRLSFNAQCVVLEEMLRLLLADVSPGYVRVFSPEPVMRGVVVYPVSLGQPTPIVGLASTIILPDSLLIGGSGAEIRVELPPSIESAAVTERVRLALAPYQITGSLVTVNYV